MFLGCRLRELRREYNLSQEDLGKMIGVTKASICGYENGSRIPKGNIFNAILDVFGVTADYLLGRDVSVVQEDNKKLEIVLSTSDIKIIREIRKNPTLFNQIANNPKRFFSRFDKKEN